MSIRLAETKLRQGKLTEAIALYNAHLAANPNDVNSLHALATAYSMHNHYLEAKTHINKALQLSTKDFALYNTLGNIERRKGQLKKAIAAFQHSLKLQPNQASTYNNLGLCYLTEQNIDQAEQAFKQALALDPTNADSRYNLATIAAKAGLLAQAEESLLEILQAHPEHTASMMQLAQIAFEQQDVSKAKNYLQMRLQYQPQHGNTLHDLGLVYLAKSDLHAALPLLRQAIEHHCDREEAHFHLATTLLMLKQPSDALTHYLKQLSHGSHLQSLYNIGVILMQQQRHQEAIAYFEQLITQAPQHIESYLNIAGIYLKLNQTENAIQYYQKVLALEPNNKEVQYILAALTQSDNPHQAPADYAAHLFDDYAKDYEQHLLKYLNYQVPNAIKRLIEQELIPDPNSLDLIDLGCGTGLVADALKRYCRQMIGIDVAKEMLTHAEAKGIYQRLIHGDIHEQLPGLQADLITAGDVFNYLGDLDAVIIACHTALLASNGYLVFTVEQGQHYPYHLEKSIRYTYHKRYIEEVLQQNGFELIRINNTILREQQHRHVEGLLVMAQAVVKAD